MSQLHAARSLALGIVQGYGTIDNGLLNGTRVTMGRDLDTIITRMEKKFGKKLELFL